jgi:hypothetical protein
VGERWCRALALRMGLVAALVEGVRGHGGMTEVNHRAKVVAGN